MLVCKSEGVHSSVPTKSMDYHHILSHAFYILKSLKTTLIYFLNIVSFFYYPDLHALSFSMQFLSTFFHHHIFSCPYSHFLIPFNTLKLKMFPSSAFIFSVPLLSVVLGGVSAPKLHTSSGLPCGILIGRRSGTDIHSQEGQGWEVKSGERANLQILPAVINPSTMSWPHKYLHVCRNVCFGLLHQG